MVHKGMKTEGVFRLNKRFVIISRNMMLNLKLKKKDMHVMITIKLYILRLVYCCNHRPRGHLANSDQSKTQR